MQTKRIRLWSKNHTLVSALSIGRFFYQSRCSFFPLFFLFRQLCLYISDSLHLFTLFLTDSLKKCQTKSFKNEYSTFCNFQILYHKSTLQIYWLVQVITVSKMSFVKRQAQHSATDFASFASPICPGR